VTLFTNGHALAPNVPAFGADIRGFNGDELHGSGISKPPPDVGERRGPLRTSCFHAERPETMAD
jgi:hypothetical protein